MTALLTLPTPPPQQISEKPVVEEWPALPEVSITLSFLFSTHSPVLVFLLLFLLLLLLALVFLLECLRREILKETIRNQEERSHMRTTMITPKFFQHRIQSY
jgi:hypothetical protein